MIQITTPYQLTYGTYARYKGLFPDSEEDARRCQELQYGTAQAAGTTAIFVGLDAGIARFSGGAGAASGVGGIKIDPRLQGIARQSGFEVQGNIATLPDRIPPAGGVRSANPIEAQSAAQYAELKEFYRQAETYGSGGIKQLESGRLRFYGQMKAAGTPGEMSGARLVREWDPMTGNTRTWYETLDSQGTVRSVRPQLDGPKVHYIFDADGNYVGTR